MCGLEGLSSQSSHYRKSFVCEFLTTMRGRGRGLGALGKTNPDTFSEALDGMNVENGEVSKQVARGRFLDFVGVSGCVYLYYLLDAERPLEDFKV